jgi:hypothetical protein
VLKAIPKAAIVKINSRVSLGTFIGSKFIAGEMTSPTMQADSAIKLATLFITAFVGMI